MVTKIKVERIFKGDNYTIGKMYINGIYLCDTLEDTVRVLNTKEDKIYGETAIPEGTYEVRLTYSPKFKRVMPEVLDVPFFTHIRIHPGNTIKDTEGCILVGYNTIKGKVTSSRIAMNKLMEELNHSTYIEIEIL